MSYLLFKFEVEFHQTEQPTSSQMLYYDYYVTSELWSHKSNKEFLMFI